MGIAGQILRRVILLISMPNSTTHFLRKHGFAGKKLVSVYSIAVFSSTYLI
jgi:hypothetical protein